MIRSTILMLAFLGAIGSHAQVSFQQAYVDKAFDDYYSASSAAMNVQQEIDKFLQNATVENFDNAKLAWTEARKLYSRTEIYRFYGGPIDDEDGPEGLINAWPLDEVYIDYVAGFPAAGIINDLATYPTIDKELLISLNEMDGEKNISTGWHTIEFLLWGQDFNNNGPGNRPVSDYIVGEGFNANRRRAYLKVVADLLVEDLLSVTNQWDLKVAGTYAHTFLAETEKEALAKAFTSLISMSGDELAVERMYVAWFGQLQEDEHSCFSDTTHNDLYNNFAGIKDQWTLVKDHVTFPAENAALIIAIDGRLAQLATQIAEMMTPFDVAIFDPVGRQQIDTIVNSLQDLSKEFIQAKEALGIITL